MKAELAAAISEPTLPRMWMETCKEDFLYLIERLKPERYLDWYQKKETRIGFDAGEVSFEVNGVQVRRPAKGEWTGYVLVPYGLLMPFLKVKPASKVIAFTYENQRVGIDTKRMAARWIAI